MNKQRLARAIVVDAAGRVVARTGGDDASILESPHAMRTALPQGGFLIALEVDIESAWHRLARAFVHEARSPLNALGIYLEIIGTRLAAALPGGNLDATGSKMLTRSSEQVRRLDALLESFVDVWAPHPEQPLDLAVLARSAGRFAQHEALRRGLQITVEACETAPIEGNPALVSAALVALFGGVLEGPAEAAFLLAVRFSGGEASLEITGGTGGALEVERLYGPGARALALAGAEVRTTSAGLHARFERAQPQLMKAEG